LINYFRQILLLLALSMLSAACGLNANRLLGPTTPQESPLPTPPTRYTISVATPQNGLEQLDSYRTNLILDFDGTRRGKPATGQIESLVEVNRPAKALHQYLTVAPPHLKTPPAISEFYRMDNKVYLFSQEGGLTFKSDEPVMPEEMNFLRPERLVVLPAVVSTPPQSKTLRGQAVQHYQFTEADLVSPQIVFERAQGEVWLTQADNLVLQYVISASIAVASPIAGADILDKGTINLRYTLTDMNAEVAITLPEHREGQITPLAKFPRLPGAEVTAIFPALLSYTSAISPISATLFYRQGLPTRGWVEEQADIYQEKSRLVFSKENETLSIIIAPADEPQKIRVSLSLDTQP